MVGPGLHECLGVESGNRLRTHVSDIKKPSPLAAIHPSGAVAHDLVVMLGLTDFTVRCLIPAEDRTGRSSNMHPERARIIGNLYNFPSGMSSGKKGL
jgi:hypothetical protein